jgi:hypothetical protein
MRVAWRLGVVVKGWALRRIVGRGCVEAGPQTWERAVYLVVGGGLEVGVKGGGGTEGEGEDEGGEADLAWAEASGVLEGGGFQHFVREFWCGL